MLRLKDGRRVYIESHYGEGDWMVDDKVTVEVLPAAQVIGWSESVGELEEFLARLWQ